MNLLYKPPGYPTVSTYLIVDGAERTMEFLVRVFNAMELRRFPGPDGKIRHAEVRMDDSVLMIADGVEGWPPVSSHVHVYVPSVDDTYRRALDAGATSVQEPAKKDDADKRGTTWWIATKVE